VPDSPRNIGAETTPFLFGLGFSCSLLALVMLLGGKSAPWVLGMLGIGLIAFASNRLRLLACLPDAKELACSEKIVEIVAFHPISPTGSVPRYRLLANFTCTGKDGIVAGTQIFPLIADNHFERFEDAFVMQQALVAQNVCYCLPNGEPLLSLHVSAKARSGVWALLAAGGLLIFLGIVLFLLLTAD